MVNLTLYLSVYLSLYSYVCLTLSVSPVCLQIMNEKMRLHTLGAMSLENTLYVGNLVQIKVSLLIYFLRSSYISLFTTWINIYNKNIKNIEQS